MRKCDICQTPIPLGQDRCPNCGYRYRPERKTTPETREVAKQQYMSQFQPHPTPIKPRVKSRPAQPQRKVRSGGVGKVFKKVILICLMVFCLISLATTVVRVGLNSISDLLSEHETLSFSDITELEQEYPEAADDVKEQMKYLQALFPEYAISDYYQYYQVTDDVLNYAYLSCDIDSWTNRGTLTQVILSCFDGEWYREAELHFSHFDQKKVEESDFSLIGRLFNIELTPLYQACMNLYTDYRDVEPDENGYITTDMPYLDYTLEMTLYLNDDLYAVFSLQDNW